MRKVEPCKSSGSSSNRIAVRHPHPLGALGKRVPACLKLPKTMTSLFEGQINWMTNKYADYLFSLSNKKLYNQQGFVLSVCIPDTGL